MIEIHDLHAVAVTPRGTRMVETLLVFAEQAITASDARNGLTVKTFSYGAVTHVTMSRAKKPRGTGGATIDLPGLPEGNLFARGARLWMAIETANDRLILRIDPKQMRPVVDLTAQRTTVSIERHMDPEP